MTPRPAAFAAVAIVCAVLGGAAALVVGNWTGWFDGERTVLVVTTAPAEPVANPTKQPPPELGNTFNPAGIYALRSPGVVTIYAFFDGRGAQGSGFVISKEGYILTNSHVITDTGTAGSNGKARPASKLFVEFADRDRVKATIVGWDVFDDVGLIRVEPGVHELTPLPLGNSSRVRVGEPVAAIGSPFGNENSLAVGVVSATQRSIASLTSDYDLVDAIQVDAPINHGNSGGPLLDAHGQVIGINAQIRSESGNAEGVGFAVPIDSARRSMAELIATGEVRYAYVGITSASLTPTLARHLGYDVRAGALIESVLPESPGDRAGLRGGDSEIQFNGARVLTGGDLIVEIDGRPVRSAEDVVRIVSRDLRPGQAARFTLLRGGSRHELEVKLGTRPQRPHGR